jgi:hypothetical protein
MSYTLLAERFPVARKAHRCIWCGESILVGEKYRNERSVFEGEMQHHHWHMECSEACAQENRDEGCSYEFSRWDNERPTRVEAS